VRKIDMGENLKGRVAAKTAQPVEPEPDAPAVPEQAPAPAVEQQIVAYDAAAVAEVAPAEMADPEFVPVHVALARVMAEVRSVGKAQLHKSATAGTWRFRGIDDVMNAVGPALRNHGVIVLPDVQDITYRDVQTKGGSQSREVTVRVRYTFVGPDGSKLSVVVPGESMDHGDKGTAKAMSVAMRIALLQALALPTDEPDPDASAYERVVPQAPAPDPAVAALAELVATTEARGWDPKTVADSFAIQYGIPANQADAGQLRAFTTALKAEPEKVLALGKQQTNGAMA
jgi:hypothetical protein